MKWLAMFELFGNLCGDGGTKREVVLVIKKRIGSS